MGQMTSADRNSEFDKPPYKVTETGWGEFVVNIRIQFVPEASEKPLNIAHSLKLHHWGPPIHAPAGTESSTPLPTLTTSAVTPAPATTVPNTPAEEATPVEEQKQDEKEAEKKGEEVETQATETSEPIQVDENNAGSTAEVKTETAASTPANTDSILAVRSIPDAPMAEVLAAQHPLSIATKMPVHSWQYDELVFSDPPSAFLDILNEHPATPLPAKLRRPRDQREQEEGPKKKQKGRVSTSGVGSRAQTQEPTGAPGPGTAAAGPLVGIHGEAGSADVPLEFAKEMEIGETNRLTDVKIEIIEQMDKLRYVTLRNCCVPVLERE